MVQDFIERIRATGRRGGRLQIRGAGSKDFYCVGCAADGRHEEREILDTRPLHGIVSYEPSELVVCVRAGTPLPELESVLAGQGQCLPFEPPHFDSSHSGPATVGGMVAAALSGPARASSGAVRDHVLGVQMINGRGQLLQFGGTVIKNVAGYDVSRLMAGSMGTLGVLTQINLKVLPVAPAEMTLRFSCDQADALARLHDWGRQPLPLNASSWSTGNGEGELHVRLRGARAAVAAACKALGGERLSEAEVAAHWQGCREQRLAWFRNALAQGKALWRLSVPQTAPVLEEIQAQIQTQTGLLDASLLEALRGTFVEWHGGQRWVAAPASVQAAAALRAIAQQAGGHARLFRAGQGQAAPPLTSRFQPLPSSLAAIHRALKKEFDPTGVFPDLPWTGA